MFNYLGIFLICRQKVNHYMTLSSTAVWTWAYHKGVAFQCMKDILSTSIVLKFYDVAIPTAISTDASSYGIGDVLL